MRKQTLMRLFLKDKGEIEIVFETNKEVNDFKGTVVNWEKQGLKPATQHSLSKNEYSKMVQWSLQVFQ